MKILIPILSHSSHPDGVSRHGINMLQALTQNPDVHHIDVPISRWQIDYVHHLLTPLHHKINLHIIDIVRSMLARNLWFYSNLPRVARTLASDLVHLPYPVPIRRGAFDCPVVVTLHDLFPYDIPQNFGYPRVLGNRLILQQCLAAADAIACVSRSTLARLIQHRPTLAHKALCVFNTVPATNTESPLPILQGKNFLLAVAQHRKNKNLPLTLEVFERILLRHPDHMLVLVGTEGPETPALQRRLNHPALRDRVLLLQGITDPELLWLYRHCRLLLSTSSVEGFGLPIAEAMLAGAPIVCSDIPAFRELGQYLCSFVPLGPGAADAFINAVEAALDNSRPAPIPLPHLSALVIAEQYTALYRRLRLVSAERLPVTSFKEHAL